MIVCFYPRPMRQILLITSLLLSFTLWAQEDGFQEEPEEGRLYILGVSATLDLYALNHNRQGLAPTSLLEFGVVSQNLSAALALDLSHLFETYDVELNDDFDWEYFVREASVQIQDVGGEPVTIVVGKQTIPFGQGYTRQPLPFFWNNHTESLREIQGVMGVSVKLSDLPPLSGVGGRGGIFHLRVLHRVGF